MKYTKDLENLKFKKVAPPVDFQYRTLPFNQMEPKVFERFCCDLIHAKSIKDGNYLDKVIPIKGEGHKQYGADIFVRSKEGANFTYTLYEVKREKNFRKKRYEETVLRFLKNIDSWSEKPNKFIVLVSDDLEQKEINRYLEGVKRLAGIGVEFDLFSATDLHQLTLNFPRVAYNYFNGAWIESVYGLAELRSIKQGESPAVPTQDSASWDNFEENISTVIEDTFRFQNKNIRLECFLPNNEKLGTSCFVEIRSGRFSDVMITLSEEELLKRYFVGLYSPYDSGVRPFLIVSDFSEKIVCDIGNCRAYFSKEEAIDICEAFDEYWDQYQSRVSQYLAEIESIGFDAHDGTKDGVVMMRIHRELWRKIISFSEANDAFETDNEWSIFDSNRYYLKIYNRSEKQGLNSGYHAFIHPMEINDILHDHCYPNQNIALFWKAIPKSFPDGKKDIYKFSDKWDVKITHDWLINSLLPKILDANKDFFKIKSGQSFLGRNKYKEVPFDDLVTSLYKPSINELPITAFEKFKTQIVHIQQFYNVPRKVYFTAVQMNSLFNVLHVILIHTDNIDFHYVSTNLQYLKAQNIDDLKEKVLEYSQTNKEDCDNSVKIDFAFRVLYSCLEYSNCQISDAKSVYLMNQIFCFYDLVSRDKLISSQLKRLGSTY